MIYADNAATTRMWQEVFEAMAPYFQEEYGNPSSLHTAGTKALQAMMQARQQIADELHCRPRHICFTSGATEANNQALLSAAMQAKQQGKMHIVSTAFEHPSVLRPLEFLQSMGFSITLLSPDANGMIGPSQVENALQTDTALVSVMMVNNEVGTIQPIREIAAICKRHGVLCHTDAVQAAGHLEFSVQDLGVDFLSISAHKFNGPKGVGALIHQGDLEPLLWGGGQERGLRAGTENVAGIVGMAAALQTSCRQIPQYIQHMQRLSEQLLSQIVQIPNSRVLCLEGDKMDGIVTVCLKGIDRQTLLILLDQQGICVSGGSACSGGALEPSHVLKSMGVPQEWAKGAIRISLGAENTLQEMDEIARVLTQTVASLRQKQGV